MQTAKGKSLLIKMLLLMLVCNPGLSFYRAFFFFLSKKKRKRDTGLGALSEILSKCV